MTTFRVKVSCIADLMEVWTGQLPDDVDPSDADALHDYVWEKLTQGELEFDSQQVDSERDREIVDIEVIE